MIRILFAKTQRTCSLMPSVFINVSIVFAGGIDVLMTEYVRYEIDITGFFIRVLYRRYYEAYVVLFSLTV